MCQTSVNYVISNNASFCGMLSVHVCLHVVVFFGVFFFLLYTDSSTCKVISRTRSYHGDQLTYSHIFSDAKPGKPTSVHPVPSANKCTRDKANGHRHQFIDQTTTLVTWPGCKVKLMPLH